MASNVTNKEQSTCQILVADLPLDAMIMFKMAETAAMPD